MEHTAKISVNIPVSEASKSAYGVTQAEIDDRELVGRCQRGDLDAYEVLVGRYRNKVYGFAFSMLRNEQDATDLCQEAFVRGWQAIHGFRKDASFYTWIYRITTNLAIDFTRRRNRRPTTPFEEGTEPNVDASVQTPPSANPSPVDEAQRKELRDQIDAALLELSPEHRAVIQLREFDGMDYVAIAKATGCSIGTVMSRLHYARKHLQKLLQEVI
ncbi:MAG TPA: sigma-70 family RNA polymerase sigma factor [Verrucomicrobiae bacterium]|nr:sigma-70 family RNA polymerase sigma factor [Verrucomicrobiae bacterium]